MISTKEKESHAKTKKNGTEEGQRNLKNSYDAQNINTNLTNKSNNATKTKTKFNSKSKQTVNSQHQQHVIKNNVEAIFMKNNNDKNLKKKRKNNQNERNNKSVENCLKTKNKAEYQEVNTTGLNADENTVAVKSNDNQKYIATVSKSNAVCLKCTNTNSNSNSSMPTNLNSTFSSLFIYTPLKSYKKANGQFRNKMKNTTNHYNSYSYSESRNFDRNFAERNKDFVPIVQPIVPILSTSNIAAVIVDTNKLIIMERWGINKIKITYPIMQSGSIAEVESTYHQERLLRMDAYQIDDGFHSDGGTETPPSSPSSSASIASTSDHGSLENVDTGGAQRLAVLSFEQVRKLHNVMDENVAIHGRGNFPTLEVKLKDLVNAVRRKLEDDVSVGGAGVIVKDIRLNGGAASHVLASEDQQYNDLDLIYAIELSSTRHFDRVKNAVLNTLLDLLPEGVSKRRIMPCALKEAYVGKMVKVNNNNDGDRWSLISLGNSPGHKNVELKFVDTMRRQFEFSVDSFQIVLDSLLLFYDCAALPISDNFYPTVVGESVYGDFQEALYHLQKKLISTRQPEEIRGGGLLKYCNLLVRNYKPVDTQRIKTLERYMCSRFFIDFPDINTQTIKLEAYLRNHFWGVEEEPLQYQYLMHLREVVETSTVCLMGHERRQTLLLIQSLAGQVLYKEQQKQRHQQQQSNQEQSQQQQQQQQTNPYLQKSSTHNNNQLKIHQNGTTAATATQSSHQLQKSSIYGGTSSSTASKNTQQQHLNATTAFSCTIPANSELSQNVNNASTVPQAIQIQAGPPGLIYANGVYYAPVIPTTICTCNSTWINT